MDKSILLLDNFDSFTYLLSDYLVDSGVNCIIERNNARFEDILQMKLSGIVLSPGPGVPENAGIMMKIIDHYHQKIPILGVCLGHQAIGQYFGGRLKKAKYPMHGKVSEIICQNDNIFSGIPSKFNVVRYHSMVIENTSDELNTLANTREGELMVVKHKNLPIYGMQFHPEAILTEYGKVILQNWLNLTQFHP